MVEKAEQMDELRMVIGSMADQHQGTMRTFYEQVCQVLDERMESYLSVSIYTTQKGFFYCAAESGEIDLPEKVPFGEGIWTIAAVRGNLVHEWMNDRSYVAVPFYQGHHLQGELVVISQFSCQLDEEDMTFFAELISLFESKGKKWGL